MVTKISVESALIDQISKTIKQEAENYKTIYERIYGIVDDILDMSNGWGKMPVNITKEYRDSKITLKSYITILFLMLISLQKQRRHMILHRIQHKVKLVSLHQGIRNI